MRAVVHVRKVVKYVLPAAPVAPVAIAGGTIDGALMQLNTMFLSGQIDAAEYERRKTEMGLSNTPPTAPPIAVVEAVPVAPPTEAGAAAAALATLRAGRR